MGTSLSAAPITHSPAGQPARAAAAFSAAAIHTNTNAPIAAQSNGMCQPAPQYGYEGPVLDCLLSTRCGHCRFRGESRVDVGEHHDGAEEHTEKQQDDAAGGNRRGGSRSVVRRLPLESQGPRRPRCELVSVVSPLQTLRRPGACILPRLLVLAICRSPR